MSLYALGISHTTAPLEVRERVVFTPEALTDALRDLTKAQHAREAAILSTCNRTEVYFAGGDPAPVASWLAQFHGMPAQSLAPYVYTLPRDKAVTIDCGQLSGLDHSCAELLRDWVERRKAHGSPTVLLGDDERLRRLAAA